MLRTCTCEAPLDCSPPCFLRRSMNCPRDSCSSSRADPGRMIADRTDPSTCTPHPHPRPHTRRPKQDTAVSTTAPCTASDHPRSAHAQAREGPHVRCPETGAQHLMPARTMAAGGADRETSEILRKLPRLLEPRSRKKRFCSARITRDAAVLPAPARAPLPAAPAPPMLRPPNCAPTAPAPLWSTAPAPTAPSG